MKATEQEKNKKHTNPHYLLIEGGDEAVSEELKDGDFVHINPYALPSSVKDMPTKKGEINNIDKLYKKVVCKNIVRLFINN